MKTLEVSEISSYKSGSPLIEILDNRGLPFYFFRNDDRKEIIFNMPSGIYFLNGCDVTYNGSPLKYICPPLPKPEKKIDIVEHLEIEVAENPNKASIDIKTGHVIIDKSFMNNEIPFVHFILFHELGHFLYSTEWKCDVFSACQMLKLGFNPSQCFYANSICLSERQAERKSILFNYLKKIKVQ